MADTPLPDVIEALLFAAGEALTLERIIACFEADAAPSRTEVRAALARLSEKFTAGPLDLCEVAGGWRLQVAEGYARWVDQLWGDKPPRYSRALLETLALITYRQPISRAEIEEVRGVSLSQSIIKTLSERQWIRVVAHREVPGRPALFGTTRRFLDDFNLKALDSLPSLPQIRDLEALNTAIEEMANGRAEIESPLPESSP